MRALTPRLLYASTVHGEEGHITPPYTLDFNLCDRFLFYQLRRRPEKQTFEDHLKIKEAALEWTHSLDGDALNNEVHRLLNHYQSVIEAGGFNVTY